MDPKEPSIRTGHPPHSITYTYKKNDLSLLHILLKVALFMVIFTLFFHLHLPNFAPRIRYITTVSLRQAIQIWPGVSELFPFFNFGIQKKQETIQEILAVLERYPTGLANATKEELAEVIYEEAIRYNHDPKFILALISIESSFRNWSVSQRGAKGLMQIMPYVARSVAQEMGIEWGGDRTLFNPFLNIRMGIYYLSQLILDFNDLELALTAYNYGPTYVKGLIERKQRVPAHYYRRIVTAYQNL